jgi:peptidoglycan hydrolase-like protein with peptidoglycan-binding domain
VGVVLLAAVASLALPTAAAIAAPRQLLSVAAGSVRATMLTTQPVLRLGSRGTAVITLQRRLATLHYDVGPIDGAFGSQTFHGVVAFQKVNGLVRDGIVGSRTWYALAHPVIPRPRRWLSSSSVEVDLTKQVVYLARQGAVLPSMAGGRAPWGCCGGRITSTAATPCTAPRRCPPIRPVTAVSE